MKEFDIFIMVDKTFITNYQSAIVPNIGDNVSTSETDIYLVKTRLLPASSGTNRIVCFCEPAKL